ncbi:MAG: ABC transporter permease [Acetobacteraceae bacterium]|nr:ABC transporter permease [Acetobacteraceae bacterium]
MPAGTSAETPRRSGAGRLLPILLRRVLLGLLTLAAVSVLVFTLVQMLPGDAAEAILGQNASPAAVAALRHELGLNEPLVARYLGWCNRLLHGEFGTSLANGLPVAGLMRDRLANTLFLAGFTAAFAIPLAFALALAAAAARGSALNRIGEVISLMLISCPQFLIAYLVIYWLAVQNPWFPSSSDIRPGQSLADQLYQAFLPMLTLSTVVIAYMFRMTRAAVADVLRHDHIRMAVLKGLRPWRILVVHALPNAIGPIAVVVALLLAYLVVGVVIVEVVFVYPGLGQLLVDAVGKRDVVVVQGVSMVFGTAFITLNMIADLAGLASNPRLLHPR